MLLESSNHVDLNILQGDSPTSLNKRRSTDRTNGSPLRKNRSLYRSQNELASKRKSPSPDLNYQYDTPGDFSFMNISKESSVMKLTDRNFDESQILY